MIPYHLHGGDIQTLVGRVDIAKGGAERNHVDVGIALGEQTALKTGVNAAHNGLLTEELLVGGNDGVAQLLSALIFQAG